MKNETTSVSVACVVPIAALLVGCSGPAYDAEELNLRGARSSQSAADDDDASGDGAGAAEPGVGAPSGSSRKPGPKGACAGEASAQSCLDCCASRSPGAVEAYTSAFGACACESPGKCASECGQTLCAGTQPDAACKACLQGSGCDDPALKACEGDAACDAFLKCSTDSACSTK